MTVNSDRVTASLHVCHCSDHEVSQKMSVEVMMLLDVCYWHHNKHWSWSNKLIFWNIPLLHVGDVLFSTQPTRHGTSKASFCFHGDRLLYPHLTSNVTIHWHTLESTSLTHKQFILKSLYSPSQLTEGNSLRGMMMMMIVMPTVRDLETVTSYFMTQNFWKSFKMIWLYLFN